MVLTVLGYNLCAQPNAPRVRVIPQPVSVVEGRGYFNLPAKIILEAPAAPALKQVIDLLEERFTLPTGYHLVRAGQGANIRLVLNKKADTSIGKEGYTLAVQTGSVVIRANEPAGLFYGVQTLLQLFPKEIESKSLVKNVAWKAPCVNIKDYPRFGWRGLMLDVSRHFFTKQQVEDFIDNMVRYKYNVLHLHLTDDEGWRVEIKSLPKLTTVGAWNVRRVGTFGSFSAPDSSEPRDYGGFYTQDDIRELVRFAGDRFVNILPEVDVPGHSLAAVASYPELSCTPGSEHYRVRSGERIMDWHDHGFSALVDNTLCPANENVYDFLDKVFGELATLFPFGYIHVGGDECAKNFWEKSDAVKALMQKEGLKDMQEVQSYFEKRVEKIVESKGKKLIGWDEILEGGLAPNAAVMSWRGMKGGVEAAKLGHDVVMTPTKYCYFDYYQSTNHETEPHAIGGFLPLNKVYAFEPVPEKLPGQFQSHIVGAQANLWTEYIPSFKHVQYMAFPRLCALAEVGWTPRNCRDYDDFTRRLQTHLARLDQLGVNYRKGIPAKD